MARLRTLCITTTDGPRDILILDKVDCADHLKGANIDPASLQAAGLPPILAFSYEVDLPEADALAEDTIDVTTHADSAQGHRVEVDVTGTDAELTRTIRKMIRIGGPSVMRAVRNAI